MTNQREKELCEQLKQAYLQFQQQITEFKDWGDLLEKASSVAALKYSVEGVLRVREEFVREHQGLVFSLAKRFSSLEDFETLLSAGNRGLVRALDRFDPSKSGAFKTYASFWITQEMREEIRKSLPISLTYREFVSQSVIKRKKRELEATLQRVLDPDELSDLLKIPKSQLLRSFWHFSSEELDEESVIEAWKAPSFAKDLLEPVFLFLSKKERKLLELRWGLNGSAPRTLKQLELLTGVFKEQIQKLERRALRVLRSLFLKRTLSSFRDFLEL